LRAGGDAVHGFGQRDAAVPAEFLHIGTDAAQLFRRRRHALRDAQGDFRDLLYRQRLNGGLADGGHFVQHRHGVMVEAAEGEKGIGALV